MLTVQPDGSFALEELPAGLGAPDFSDLTGLPGDNTALASALAGKAATSHTHAIADTTGLQTALDGKAASSHAHATSEVTGLDAALAGKAATSHTHAIADTTGLQTALDGKAASSHTHATSEVTGLDAALAGDRFQVLPGIRPDLYYSSYPSGTTSPRTVTINRIFFTPLWIPHAITVTRIGVNVTTGVTGNMRLGIFGNSSGIPSGAAILDAGTVNVGTTGEKEITVSQALTPGLYWLACVADCNAVVTADFFNQMAAYNLGYLSGSAAANSVCYFQHTSATFPTISSVVWQSATIPPRVWIRTP